MKRRTISSNELSTVRYALKFAYDGTKFDSYQRQRSGRTVESEILAAMKRTKMILEHKSAKFQSASRTDKGVSALGNVIAFNTDFRATEILSALNANVSDIWVYGIAKVPINFNPRFASQRWYRYYLQNENLNEKIMKKVADIFVGVHNFSNFCKIDERYPARKIDAIKLKKYEDFIIIDFFAENFLWHMVRRIVATIEKIGKEECTIEEVQNALNCVEKRNFGTVPAEPLILMDVKYDFKFDGDKKNRIIILDRLKEKLRSHFIKTRFLNEFIKIIKN